MNTYAIGDVQGCYTELQMLLQKIRFDAQVDTLWFTGDLVNRGPNSLQTLRFVKALGDRAITVLGNHDLHLLSIAHGMETIKTGDTIADVLNAADCDELLDWLCQQPLLHHDRHLSFTMTHAGIAPQWDLQQAQQFANEVEQVLRSHQRTDLFRNMYGNQPACWHENLQGMPRMRCLINYFTRMRYCDRQACLDLSFKGNTKDAPPDLIPWFDIPDRKMKNNNIIFGHWAALAGITHVAHVFALDTGCVWGQQLTAMCLETGVLTQVQAR